MVVPGASPTTLATKPPRSTQRRSAVAVPLSSREISSRSSTSRSSRSTRSRIASPTWSWSSRLAAVFSPVSGVRRSWATSATNRRSRSIRCRIASAIRSIASPSFATSSWPPGIDPRVQLAGGHALGDRRRPPQPQREPSGQQQADQRPAHRRRRGHLDHRLAQVAQLLALRRVGVAHVDLVAPVRRAPARPHGRLAVPGAAVGRQLAPAHRRAQRRRHRRVAGRQRRARAATAWSAGRSAPPTAPGPPRPPGRGRAGPRRSPRRPRCRPPPPPSQPAARMRAPAAIAASSSPDQLVARPANGLDHVRADLRPQAAYVHVHQPRVARPDIAPHLLEQALAAADRAAVLGQLEQQPVLGRGEADRARPPTRTSMPARSISSSPTRSDGRRVVARDPAQHRPQPRRQDRRLERLGDVVVGARPRGPARRRSDRCGRSASRSARRCARGSCGTR